MHFRSLFGILALLAMLLAPLGMLGSHAAMAMPHQAEAAEMADCHSEKQAPEDRQQQSMIDCAVACSAMPSADPLAVPEPMLIAPQYKLGPSLFADGTRPEAATPPPRIS